MNDPMLRTPPSDLAAERAVLGAALLSPDALSEMLGRLRAEDFYRPAHAAVFEAILDLDAAAEPVDAVSVLEALHKRDMLERVGGPLAIHSLLEGTPSAASAGHYARIVADKAALRRLGEAASRIVEGTYGPVDDVARLIDKAQAVVFDATAGRATKSINVAGSYLDEVLAAAEAAAHQTGTSGVPTGFADLDEITNGLKPGQLWIIAARPSIGKSTLGLDICRSASIRHDMTSAIFSLEMTAQEIVRRMLSAEARVRLNALDNGQLTEEDWSRIARRLDDIGRAKLYIDDTPGITASEIRAKARRLKQTDDLRLLVVDYLQLMSSSGRPENRQQEVAEFAQAMKNLAKELRIPVIALAQLNRAADQRANKRPVMSDIRESGAIEAHADGIILLFREEEVDPDSARAGEADFIIEKNRNGAKGTVTVAFQGHYSRFVDMAKDWEGEGV